MGKNDHTIVYLGNRKAVEVLDDPDDIDTAASEERAPNKVRAKLPGKRCTTVVFPAGTTLMQAVNDLTTPNGVWAAHSDASAPAWVASNDPTLAKFLADHWGSELREPDPEHVASSEEG